MISKMSYYSYVARPLLVRVQHSEQGRESQNFPIVQALWFVTYWDIAILKEYGKVHATNHYLIATWEFAICEDKTP